MRERERDRLMGDIEDERRGRDSERGEQRQEKEWEERRGRDRREGESRMRKKEREREKGDRLRGDIIEDERQI